MLILNYWIDHPNWFLIKSWAKFNFANFDKILRSKNWKCRISHLIFRMNFYKSIHDGNWEIPPFFAIRVKGMWNFLRNFSGAFDSIWIYGWTTCDDTGGLRTDWNGPDGFSQRRVNVDQNYLGKNYYSRAKKSKYFNLFDYFKTN